MLFEFTKRYLKDREKNLRDSSLPECINQVRQSQWAVNLDHDGFKTSLQRVIEPLCALVDELVRLANQANEQGRPKMISGMLGLTMQRVWLSLVAVDRALSCRVLANYLDPKVDSGIENFALETQNLAKASKMIEPFILLYIEKPNGESYDQQFLTKIFTELKKTFILDRVIHAYLIDFKKVPVKEEVKSEDEQK